MQHDSTVDTIVACASGDGRSGVAIVRLSGPLVAQILERCVSFSPVKTPRKMCLATLFHPDRSPLDHVLSVYFKGPHSYTGEDVAEVHMHGSPVLVQEALRLFCAQGARMAKPGEFTERAFLNGKLNLMQAEAVCDIVNSETLATARAAQASLQGVFSERVYALEKQLEWVRVHVEAGIDFSEQAIAPEAMRRLVEHTEALMLALQCLLEDTQRALKRQKGLKVVIAGAPNAGKSTLLNALAQEELAIVTNIPGTTRDSLKLELVHAGVRLEVVDTAGLRESEDVVEQMGIAKTRSHMMDADVVWVLVDGGHHKKPALNQVALLASGVACPTLLVHTKMDALALPQRRRFAGEVCIAAKQHEGLEALLEKTIMVSRGLIGEKEGAFFARQRHVEGLETALEHLNDALAHVEAPDLFSEDLRLVQLAFAELTGQYSHERLLDGIFQNFCLGK